MSFIEIKWCQHQESNIYIYMVLKDNAENIYIGLFQNKQEKILGKRPNSSPFAPGVSSAISMYPKWQPTWKGSVSTRAGSLLCKTKNIYIKIFIIIEAKRKNHMKTTFVTCRLKFISSADE